MWIILGTYDNEIKGFDSCSSFYFGMVDSVDDITVDEYDIPNFIKSFGRDIAKVTGFVYQNDAERIVKCCNTLKYNSEDKNLKYFVTETDQWMDSCITHVITNHEIVDKICELTDKCECKKKDFFESDKEIPEIDYSMSLDDLMRTIPGEIYNPNGWNWKMSITKDGNQFTVSYDNKDQDDEKSLLCSYSDYELLDCLYDAYTYLIENRFYSPE